MRYDTNDVLPDLQRAQLSISADSTVVEAVAGQRIKVHGLYHYCTGGIATYQSGASGIAGAVVPGSSVVTIVPISTVPYFETDAGEALTVNLSATDANHIIIFYTVGA